MRDVMTITRETIEITEITKNNTILERIEMGITKRESTKERISSIREKEMKIIDKREKIPLPKRELMIIAKRRKRRKLTKKKFQLNHSNQKDSLTQKKTLKFLNLFHLQKLPKKQSSVSTQMQKS
jgi:hypothetical protein